VLRAGSLTAAFLCSSAVATAAAPPGAPVSVWSMARTDANVVHLELGSVANHGSDRWNVSRAVRASDFKPVPDLEVKHAVDFELARGAGTFRLVGRSNGSGSASGTFDFQPNRSFTGLLVRQGLAHEVDDVADAAAVDLNGVDMTSLHEADPNATLADMVAAKSVGLTPSDYSALLAAFSTPPPLRDAVALRVAGVDVAYVTALRNAGVVALTPNACLALKSLDVSGEDARLAARHRRSPLTASRLIAWKAITR